MKSFKSLKSQLSPINSIFERVFHEISKQLLNLDERKKLDEKWVHAGKDNIFPKLQKTLLTIRAVNNHKGSKLEILFDSRLF